MKAKRIAGIFCLGIALLVGASCPAAGEHPIGPLDDEQVVPEVKAEKAKKKMTASQQTMEDKLLGLDMRKMPEKPPEMAAIPSPKGEPAVRSLRKERPEPGEEMAVIP